MAEQTHQPVVIDADAFDPVPRNTFAYRGENYGAFDLMQLRGSQRERIKRLDKHLDGCRSLDEQIALLAEVVCDFVPKAPIDSLKDEPLEMLMDNVFRLAGAIGRAGEARPTTGRRRSGSRRSTSR